MTSWQLITLVTSTWAESISPAIAVLALFFTIGSFWWLQARQGRLRSYPPHSFGFYCRHNQALIRFPLVLYNTGAKPIVVQDLRLLFPNASAVEPLLWRTSRSQLMPASDDRPELPSVFSVSGRTAQQHFIEFGVDRENPLTGIDLTSQSYPVLIEGRLGHKQGWQRLQLFPLEGKEISYASADPMTSAKVTTAYIAYGNTALRPAS